MTISHRNTPMTTWKCVVAKPISSYFQEQQEDTKQIMRICSLLMDTFK